MQTHFALTPVFYFNNVSDGSHAECRSRLWLFTTQPNPSWFYIRIDLPGDLSLQIEQNTKMILLELD